jgi:hypothetical protein
MRLALAAAAVLTILSTAPVAAQHSPAAYSLQASPSRSSEVCRGTYVFILTAYGGAGDTSVYTLATGPRNENVRATWFLADGPTLMHHVSNRVENGAVVGLLFVALDDPSRPAAADLELTGSGQTHAISLRIPASQNPNACERPAFYGAPSV